MTQWLTRPQPCDENYVENPGSLIQCHDEGWLIMRQQLKAFEHQHGEKRKPRENFGSCLAPEIFTHDCLMRKVQDLLISFYHKGRQISISKHTTSRWWMTITKDQWYVTSILHSQNILVPGSSCRNLWRTFPFCSPNINLHRTFSKCWQMFFVKLNTWEPECWTLWASKEGSGWWEKYFLFYFNKKTFF